MVSADANNKKLTVLLLFWSHFNVLPMKQILIDLRENEAEREVGGIKGGVTNIRTASVGSLPHSFLLLHPSHVFSTRSVLKWPSWYDSFHPAPSDPGENQKGCKCLSVRMALKPIPWRQKRAFPKGTRAPNSTLGHYITAWGSKFASQYPSY